mmetsp:Transcript_15965/g.25571  ORF Transcript_15965/g.25571 Transcript_15965/m.25571 type:complete len:87 (+) Transcript_15965:405-665(+)
MMPIPGTNTQPHHLLIVNANTTSFHGRSTQAIFQKIRPTPATVSQKGLFEGPTSISLGQIASKNLKIVPTSSLILADRPGLLQPQN